MDEIVMYIDAFISTTYATLYAYKLAMKFEATS